MIPAEKKMDKKEMKNIQAGAEKNGKHPEGKCPNPCCQRTDCGNPNSTR